MHCMLREKLALPAAGKRAAPPPLTRDAAVCANNSVPAVRLPTQYYFATVNVGRPRVRTPWRRTESW